MKTIYIGIDPGEHTGLALYDSEKGLRLFTFSFWDTCEYIKDKIAPAFDKGAIRPVFVVENPGLNNFSYEERVRNKPDAVSLKIARNVGMNINDGKRIIELIRRLNMEVQEVKPDKSSPKWSAEFMNKIAKQEVTCSQHARDVAKLINRYWWK